MSKPPKIIKRKCTKCGRIFNIQAKDYFIITTLWCAPCGLEMDKRANAPD